MLSTQPYSPSFAVLHPALFCYLPLMRKTVFLDIGGVLLSNGWGHESREAAAEKFGFDYKEMNTHHEFIFNVYEIGGITLDEYLDRTLFCEPRNFSKEAISDFIFSQSVELPYMLQWLKAWKSDNANKIRLISVNNEGRELNNYRVKTFRLDECFDAFVTSCEVGYRKPDPRIFHLAMGIAQVTKDDCIYFDDRSILVDAARQLGIRAHHHRNFQETKEILEALVD